MVIILSQHHTIGGKKIYGVEDSYRSSYSATRSVSSRSCDPQTGHSSHLRKQPSSTPIQSPKQKQPVQLSAVHPPTDLNPGSFWHCHDDQKLPSPDALLCCRTGHLNHPATCTLACSGRGLFSPVSSVRVRCTPHWPFLFSNTMAVFR